MQKNIITRLTLVLIGCIMLVPVFILPANAIPVFARKYGFKCTMCHSNFPRLNDFGTRFRKNGYQLPGKENLERTILESPPPFAIRTSGGYNSDRFKNIPGSENINQFQINGVDLLSGGLFGRNIGYIFVYPPEIKGSSGVAAQDGVLEMASVAFSNINSSWLNIRVGRFEPAYVAFSNARRLSVSPYDIYDYSFPLGLALGDTQSGVEFTGYGRNGLSYAMGWIDRSANNAINDAPSDMYFRLAKVIGSGEGETSGHRIGLTGYSGQGRQSDMSTGSRESFTRWGPDASLNFQNWNFGIQYLAGSDKNILISAEPETIADFDFSGGFIQALYMPKINMVGYARYDWVNVSEEFDIGDVSRWTVGSKYYLEDNLALQVEYSRRTEKALISDGDDNTEDFFTTRLDFAF